MGCMKSQERGQALYHPDIDSSLLLLMIQRGSEEASKNAVAFKKRGNTGSLQLMKKVVLRTKSSNSDKLSYEIC